MDVSGVRTERLIDFLLQALETERGALRIYAAALDASMDEGVHRQWLQQRDATRGQERSLVAVLAQLDIDTERDTPERTAAHQETQALVGAIERAIADTPAGAQLIASECVMLIEKKVESHWNVLASLARFGPQPLAQWLMAACDEADRARDAADLAADQVRELWLDTLGAAPEFAFVHGGPRVIARTIQEAKP